MTQLRGIILIIDDNKELIAAIREPLRYCGFQVIAAMDVRRAIEISQEVKPSLILLDLKMPGTNGVEFLKKYRATEKDVPIILLTGYYDEFKSQITPEMKVFGYLPKRFYKRELEQMVYDALKKPDSDRTFSEMAKARLLIVDDEDEITSWLGGLFREKEFVVATANRADRALAFNKHFRADIVIADIKMPGGMDGIDMVHELRKSEKPPRAAFFMSGVGDNQYSLDKMRELFGKEEYVIPKPFNHETMGKLMEQIEAVIKETKTKADG